MSWRRRTSSSKVLVINDRDDSYSSYYSPFAHLGEYCGNTRILEIAPEEVICAVFTGGQDVDPSVYGHKRSKLTSWSRPRDDFEIDAFRLVRRHDVPIFGICRGAQLMCALSGGTLCQHLSNHGGRYHEIQTSDGRVVRVNSYHHQMQMPPKDAEVLAWSLNKISDVYIVHDDRHVDMDLEIEVVHYPSINAMGVQYHPEMMAKATEGYQYFQRLVDTMLYWQRYRPKNARKILMDRAG